MFQHKTHISAVDAIGVGAVGAVYWFRIVERLAEFRTYIVLVSQLSTHGGAS